ncbi:892_t:CDS:2 [Cetraspora pellucida]|uniref:892_t:CDS:1 n=1 Tax=Cetraspora pellucida TaxID=1433469 RepID=A0ACA9LLM2_9GLOM|nr:892_t:CDS:2 [Cetraspora pellucida]
MSSKTIKSAKPKKSKAKRSGRSKNATKTKIVVRRLPPLLPENLFLESVKQWANEETIDWYRFHQGRISNENKAVVEFAVYQKLPKEHKKSDPRQGTIENDPDYLAFLESLKADENRQATLKEPGSGLEGGATQLERLEARLTATAASNTIEKPKSTPLLDHLRAQKSGAKSKSPPPKQSQVTVLSPPGSPAKSSKTKQMQQIRGIHMSEVTFPPGPGKPTRKERERKKREKEKERREKDRKEKDNDKSKEIKDEIIKDVEKVKELGAIDDKNQERPNDKSKERNREKESHREKDREKMRERRKERERQKLKEKQKVQAGTAKSETPVVTILTKPQVKEDIKSDAKDKEIKKSTPIKITIQQRQKDQIRQIIKESVKEPAVESPNETSSPTTTPATSNTSITSETKEHPFNRRRERDRSRKVGYGMGRVGRA